MKRSLVSAKFFTLIIDVVVTLITYFITKYAAPGIAEDVLFVLGLLQPVFLAVIVAIMVEDASGSKKLIEALTSQLNALIKVDDKAEIQ